MVTKTKITNNLKISEFPEIFEAFISTNKSKDSYWKIIELVLKQTEAKQQKWWAYYDKHLAETFYCPVCEIHWQRKFEIGCGFGIHTDCQTKCAKVGA